MLELIFVIVVIGILAGVALPKLWVTRDDAIISKGRSEVATIRSAISTQHQTALLEGNTSYPATLDSATANAENQPLFNNVLDYPIYSKDADGHWMKTDDTQYSFKVQGQDVTFTYTPATGHFDCDHTNTNCQQLTH
ncbi:MAG: ABC transporter permease [Hydrogenimonas sp.]|nr:MAG: ABC transporter permease [Hydrogenimonas sp.]